jgi:hypothetical protein
MPEAPPAPQPKAALEDRIYRAVREKVGPDVDDHLLKTIISRVLKSVKGG